MAYDYDVKTTMWKAQYSSHNTYQILENFFSNIWFEKVIKLPTDNFACSCNMPKKMIIMNKYYLP